MEERGGRGEKGVKKGEGEGKGGRKGKEKGGKNKENHCYETSRRIC